MLELNTEVLNQVVETACHDAAAHPRWLVAIGRAVVELISNPYLERQDGHLLVASPSGSVYAANGVCQCKAYEFGQPCWHRAAARLVRLHDEREAAKNVYTYTCKRCGTLHTTNEPVDSVYCECAWKHIEVSEVSAPARPTVAKLLAAARAKAELNELFA